MTSKSSIDPKNFRQRYAIERMAGGGLLVDFATGDYFRLNATAVEICRVLFEGTSSIEVAREVANRLGVTTQDAVGLLSGMERALETPAIREEPPGPFRYVQRVDSYDLLEHDRSILAVDAGGRHLRLCSSLRDLSYPLVDYLRAIAPKILRLRGIPTLHASACIFANGALTGFSGRSGAGKTTTASAFQAAGAHLVSEDLVVLSATGDLVGYLQGEQVAHAWSVRIAAELMQRPDAIVDCAELSRAADGPAAPLSVVWFVDAARRNGETFLLRRLSAMDGFIALLSQSFLAAADVENLQRHLGHTRRLAEEVTLFAATVPDGLEDLARAARDQSANSAS